MNVILFSRPVRSGKSTELAAWCRGRTNVKGILMPDIDGVRFFEDISTGRRWRALAGEGEPAIEVGPFRFSQVAFEEAIDLITQRAPSAWLVIDEIGKLELDGKGFAGALSAVLGAPPKRPANLLLVVRDNLLEAVMEKFGLQDASIVHSLDGL